MNAGHRCLRVLDRTKTSGKLGWQQGEKEPDKEPDQKYGAYRRRAEPLWFRTRGRRVPGPVPGPAQTCLALAAPPPCSDPSMRLAVNPRALLRSTLPTRSLLHSFRNTSHGAPLSPSFRNPIPSRVALGLPLGMRPVTRPASHHLRAASQPRPSPSDTESVWKRLPGDACAHSSLSGCYTSRQTCTDPGRVYTGRERRGGERTQEPRSPSRR